MQPPAARCCQSALKAARAWSSQRMEPHPLACMPLIRRHRCTRACSQSENRMCIPPRTTRHNEATAEWHGANLHKSTCTSRAMPEDEAKRGRHSAQLPSNQRSAARSDFRNPHQLKGHESATLAERLYRSAVQTDLHHTRNLQGATSRSRRSQRPGRGGHRNTASTRHAMHDPTQLAQLTRCIMRLLQLLLAGLVARALSTLTWKNAGTTRGGAGEAAATTASQSTSGAPASTLAPEQTGKQGATSFPGTPETTGCCCCCCCCCFTSELMAFARSRLPHRSSKPTLASPTPAPAPLQSSSSATTSCCWP